MNLVPLLPTLIYHHHEAFEGFKQKGFWPREWGRGSAGHENSSGGSAAKRWRDSLASVNLPCLVAEFRSPKQCTLSVQEGIIVSQKVQSALIQLLSRYCRPQQCLAFLLSRILATACSEGCLASNEGKGQYHWYDFGLHLGHDRLREREREREDVAQSGSNMGTNAKCSQRRCSSSKQYIPKKAGLSVDRFTKALPQVADTKGGSGKDSIKPVMTALLPVTFCDGVIEVNAHSIRCMLPFRVCKSVGVSNLYANRHPNPKPRNPTSFEPKTPSPPPSQPP